MTIKESLARLDAQIRKAESALTLLRKRRKEVEALQKTCDHKFTPPLKNYEHEGGYCSECGVNELYAYTLKALR